MNSKRIATISVSFTILTPEHFFATDSLDGREKQSSEPWERLTEQRKPTSSGWTSANDCVAPSRHQQQFCTQCRQNDKHILTDQLIYRIQLCTGSDIPFNQSPQQRGSQMAPISWSFQAPNSNLRRPNRSSSPERTTTTATHETSWYNHTQTQDGP